MKVRIAEFMHLGAPILVALVESKYTEAASGDPILRTLSQHFPTIPAMLVSIEANGFRAHAHFQTQKLLALLQLEKLNLTDFDLGTPLPEPELPF